MTGGQQIDSRRHPHRQGPRARHQRGDRSEGPEERRLGHLRHIEPDSGQHSLRHCGEHRAEQHAAPDPAELFKERQRIARLKRQHDRGAPLRMAQLDHVRKDTLGGAEAPIALAIGGSALHFGEAQQRRIEVHAERLGHRQIDDDDRPLAIGDHGDGQAGVEQVAASGQGRRL